jgi:hypothetical protein
MSGGAQGAPGAPVLELLDWLARGPRSLRETIETWGSHCPRATPWGTPSRPASSG